MIGRWVVGKCAGSRKPEVGFGVEVEVGVWGRGEDNNGIEPQKGSN